jgi:transcriptional repressor NrdR
MVCVYCGNQTKVTNSRFKSKLNRVWRRRQCIKCKSIFTTEESPNYSAIWTVKGSDGLLRSFERDKLFLSILKSCEHRKTATLDAGSISDTIIFKLRARSDSGLIESSSISQTASVTLNRFDKVASIHYQALHTK